MLGERVACAAVSSLNNVLLPRLSTLVDEALFVAKNVLHWWFGAKQSLPVLVCVFIIIIILKKYSFPSSVSFTLRV